MPTYEELSRTQLLALSTAVGQSNASAGYINLQASLMRPWGARKIPKVAPYPSSIGDDHSPYEYSVAYGARYTELRILLEAQAAEPDLLSNHMEALRVNERLRTQWGASLSRFEQIADLFMPASDAAAHGFSLWHAACLSPTGLPDFKVYLNPQLHGREAADDVIDEVIGRLGLVGAKEALAHLRFRGREQDELKYLSLDLSDKARARVKIYVCHHDAQPEQLERAFTVAPSHRAGDAANFCAAMAPQTARFDRKPISSCLAFVAGDPEPYTVTMHLPIAHYAESDAHARRRIASFMTVHGMDELLHTRVLRSLARTPLETSSGIQSYASYRRQDDSMRLTVYLSPELYRHSGSRQPYHRESGQRGGMSG
jgi:DMATS type aromatic prenyltransferase